jgi:MoaA/NifB/PqqE/SkfB family radical SAM enzyme
MTKQLNYWDHVSEYETDPSWRDHPPAGYAEYRKRFEETAARTYTGDFPVSLEVECSYHCNLSCPSCARGYHEDRRELTHMSQELWDKIITECRDNKLDAIFMDHEAESLMNPRFVGMLNAARDAGIIDIWLHTNACLLKPELAEQLIDGGLSKINFSIDAFSEEVYDKIRVGGNFQKVMSNIDNFLKLKKQKGADHLRVRVSFVVQEDNLHERQAFFDYWKNKSGINLVTFQERIDFSLFFQNTDPDDHLSEAELDEKYKDVEPFYCSLPYEQPIIDVHGNVIPCGMPISEQNQDFILGNLLLGETIKSCWMGEKMRLLKERLNQGKWYRTRMCRICSHISRNTIDSHLKKERLEGQ